MKAPMLLLSTLLLASTALAAEPEMLTLACQGTVNYGIPSLGTDNYPGKQHDPQPISMVLVLNFTTQKVEITGVYSLSSRRIIITPTTEAKISLLEEGDRPRFIGMINRLTGEMDAGDTRPVDNLFSTTSYALKCTSTERKF